MPKVILHEPPLWRSDTRGHLARPSQSVRPIPQGRLAAWLASRAMMAVGNFNPSDRNAGLNALVRPWLAATLKREAIDRRAERNIPVVHAQDGHRHRSVLERM